ncbi:MAG: DUF6249 domain-containing protein [Ignavibacteriae bacterium]|jgi:phosphatidylglycerophosphate synthase|nr:DUF6249 domain-containing protein [Ignavibacteriota bacterium]
MNNAIESMIPIFGILAVFGLPAIIIFWFIYTKHRERMRLIEKGLTPDEIKNYFRDADKKPRNPYSALKWGILLVFLGLGIFAANLLEQIYDFSDGATFGLVVLFAGAGFLLYYIIVRSKISPEPKQSINIPNN